MSETGLLFATREATRESWGFGPLPPECGAMLLVGWSRPLAFASDDEPAPFVAILAAALTRLGPLAFPTSIRPDAVARACQGSATFAHWAPGRPASRFSQSALCLTRDVALAATLFDDGAFPWGLQGQFGLLCAEHVLVETLATLGIALDSLIEPGWGAALPGMNAVGVNAVLRPGVDGDLAGLLAADAAGRENFIEALAYAARQSSVPFNVLDEGAFSAALVF